MTNQSRALTVARRSPNLWATLATAVVFSAAPIQSALAQTAPTLGTAQSFAVLAGTPNVTNTGPTVVSGNLGIHPAVAVTGFPPGIVIGGTIHAGDAVALQAKSDLTSAYNALDAQGCTFTFANASDLVGLTLGPGVYCSASSLFLSGTLTLDAQFDPNAVWIFKTGSTLITASGSTVRIINDGQHCNVFWKVGSSATLGTSSTFIGNILALTSITLTTNAQVSGRVLAQNGAVTMDTNTVAASTCAVPPVGPIPPTLSKAFSPAAINAGDTGTLTITLSNADATAAAITSLIDTLPAGVFVAAGAQSTTCVGGTVAASIGSSTVELTGGAIPANNGSCTVTVPVTSLVLGLHVNTLAIGALQTGNGNNAAPAFASLNVVGPGAAPTLVKTFAPASINAGGLSTLTITLSNTNGSLADLSAALIDTLPAGVSVAAIPGVVNTCGGAVTANPGATTVTLSAAAAIPARASCSVSVNVTAPVAGNYLNVLIAGALKTNRGTNAAPALATLAVVPVIIPPAGGTPGLALSKTANPASYTTVGEVITYTYILKNTGDVMLTGAFTVTDDKLGTFVCATTSLAPGATVSCTMSYTIQASDLGDESSLPQGVVANVVTSGWLASTGSTLRSKITGARPGVANGTYRCWCLEPDAPGSLYNQPARLYSTAGTGLPADAASLPWGKINYTLNHMLRGPGTTNLAFVKDVQTVLWILVGDTTPEFGVSAAAQQMLDAANANADFVPAAGDIVAVLLHSDGIHVPSWPGEIQESICEMTSKLKTIVNKATGSVPFGTGVVVSGTVQATVKQVVIR